LKQFGLPILPEQRKVDFSRAPAVQRGPYQAGQEKAAMDSTPAGEYVKGLKESDVTALNTREYVFFGFFQRIRERLDLAWSRLLYDHLSRIARQGRMIASERDHTTRLLVVMNAEGKITRVQVLEESGTFDLDDAAVKAFNQAGPFPNPPKGLVDSSGSIEIRWDFILRT
jgi:protein TonB